LEKITHLAIKTPALRIILVPYFYLNDLFVDHCLYFCPLNMLLIALSVIRNTASDYQHSILNTAEILITWH